MEHNHLHTKEEHNHMDHSMHDHMQMSGHDHMQMSEHDHSSMAGHDHHNMLDDFKKRFWVSLILALPLTVLFPMLQDMTGIHFTFTGAKYISFVLSTIVFIYGGYPFLSGLVNEIKGKKPGMMTLIGIAISVAYIYSSATVFGLKGEDFYWELATLILIMLAGHWIEMKSVMGASKALQYLVELLPSEAHLIENSQTRDIPVKELMPGNLILIKPGEKIPADGIIKEGESYINESMLTGESKPVTKGIGANVIGGAINGNGVLTVEVRFTGEQSYLSKVIKLVSEAQQSKSNTQRLADKAAFALTIVAVSAGLITLISWLGAGFPLAFAIERMVTVMVISCPHALRLAIPLVVAISTGISAKNGLLIRDRTAFENSRKISTIIFDKTGTLTKGEFGVSNFASLDTNFTKENILGMAASLESGSEHPIASGIIKKAKELSLAQDKAENVNALSGQGIEGTIDGKKIQVVSPGYLKEKNITFIDKTNVTETIVYVLSNENLIGSISLSDQIRAESFPAIQSFHEMGIKTLLLTGDNKKVAESVAKELKMDGFVAEVLPHQKLEKIKELQAKGEFVAMTGDGVNDAPALAQADVGIAIGSGTDIAAETADIILVNSNPMDVLSLIKFGKATYSKMIQNLWIAAGYNIIAIPLAAGVLYKYDILLSPAVGAVLMTCSTLLVAANAQLLRRQKMK